MTSRVTVSMRREDVADRRTHALVFSREHLSLNHMLPTLREIADAIGLCHSSASTVNGYMEWHVRHGNARKIGKGAHTRYMPMEVAS